MHAALLSYVGEAGWELTCRAEDTGAVYAALTGAGAVPASLYVQNSMRIEKGFAAMGHEFDGDLTPAETGMERFCSKRKPYVGSDVIAERRKTGRRTLTTILFDDAGAVPLGHEPVCSEGEIVGRTTSAAFGFRIGRPVALGHVKAQEIDGRRVAIDIAGTRHPARMQIAHAFDPALRPGGGADAGSRRVGFLRRPRSTVPAPDGKVAPHSIEREHHRAHRRFRPSGPGRRRAGGLL